MTEHIAKWELLEAFADTVRTGELAPADIADRIVETSQLMKRLTEALRATPQYIALAHLDGTRNGLDRQTLSIAEKDLEKVNAAISEAYEAIERAKREREAVGGP